ncbi:MAG: PASTA domain-containing protein [Candidatus Cloacimonadaceae bacterium]|jgi:beta-lactam-binding protein with PASTA domain
MDKEKLRKLGYYAMIGLGTILITAFLVGQVIMPLIFAKPKSIMVPNVLGSDVGTAKKTLQEAGLYAVVKDSLWSDTAKIESVLEQRPAAGEMIKAEGTVYLVICKGSQMVAVPTVVGHNYEEAFVTLRSAGLRVAVADSMHSASFPRNTVMRTSPPSGSRVQKNALVSLYMSRGPEEVREDEEFGSTEDEYPPGTY